MMRRINVSVRFINMKFYGLYVATHNVAIVKDALY